MGKKNQNQGCCPDTHAKCFEIILIIGFALSIIVLTVNFILNLWCFKLSIYLFILIIASIALSAISIIFSIILRVWRSDDSVLRINYSSSNTTSCFLLVLVIINILSSVSEETLYYFIYDYFIIENKFFECTNDINNICPEITDLLKKLEKASEILKKILNKVEKKGFGFKDDKDEENKKKLIKLVPWIAFNFNILILILMIVFVIILKGRIKIKNHFGFPPKDNSQSSKSEIIINDKSIADKKLSKKKKKKKEANVIDFSNIESDAATNLKNKKIKKKKKKRNSKKN